MRKKRHWKIVCSIAATLYSAFGDALQSMSHKIEHKYARISSVAFIPRKVVRYSSCKSQLVELIKLIEQQKEVRARSKEKRQRTEKRTTSFGSSHKCRIKSANQFALAHRLHRLQQIFLFFAFTSLALQFFSFIFLVRNSQATELCHGWMQCIRFRFSAFVSVCERVCALFRCHSVTVVLR